MGGIEQVISQIARGSRCLGIESDVLSLSPNPFPSTIEIDGYKVHRVKLNIEIASTGFSLAAFSRFSLLAKQADVIHYHYPWPFMDVVHFASRVHKPTVVTYHSDIIRQNRLLALYQPLQRCFLASVSRIVATSSNYVNSSKLLERYKSKLSVIPIGLDISSYPQPEEARLNFWRQQVGESFFLFVGVLRYYKGLHILLEASRGQNFPIVIVGSGPIEQELKILAQKLKLTHVKFLGYLPELDKVALLKLCLGVLFPSHLRSEAFGIALLEGAMYGKPMISSEIGTGTTYINIENETGLVVPPSDPDALRRAMRYLWEHPYESALMGKKAKERYWQHFTARKMVDSYANLYREIASIESPQVL